VIELAPLLRRTVNGVSGLRFTATDGSRRTATAIRFKAKNHG
jgi:hypothetical protein